MAELAEGMCVFFTLQLNTAHNKVFESIDIQSEYLHHLQQTLTQVDMKKTTKLISAWESVSRAAASTRVVLE